MLYALLKIVTRIALRVFFSSVELRGLERIPADVPLLIVANHPNTFMDALIVGSIVKRPVYFLARGNLFASPLAERLFERLNMIPLHRRVDDPGKLGRNADIFRRCYSYLARGKSILIFPEGVSRSERRLQTIQSGAARIALGAEAEYDFGLGLAIVPVGLNYSDPAGFRSAVLVNIGDAITVESYAAQFHEQRKAAINALTDRIRKALKTLVYDIDSQPLDTLVHNIEQIYKADLRDSMQEDSSPPDDFVLTQGIIDAVKHFEQQEPERVESTQRKIARYMRALRRLQVHDKVLRPPGISRSLLADGGKTLLFFLIGLPLYLFGLLNNFLPYRIPGWLTPRIVRDVEYHGPTKMTLGIVTFVLFYGLQIALVAVWTSNFWLAAIYALSLPPSGFFAFYFWHWLLTVRSNFRYLALFYQRSRLISGLIVERRAIVRLLEEARADYLAAQAAEHQ